MIRIGFIGAGGISVEHLNYLKTRGDVKVAALSDVNPDLLERRRKEFGGETFADFRAMLAKTPLDAVYLCTPPQVRRDPILACARKGVAVFCEKPAGRDMRSALRLARDIKAARARVQVGYVFRSMPSVERLREAMRDDDIYAGHSFYGCPLGRTRTCPSWFQDKKISGGPLIDQATHNLDLLRCLLGEVKGVRGLAANPAEKKHPGYTVDEVVGLSLRFTGGLVACHLHSWVAAAWRNEVFLSGRKRFYRLNLNQGTLVVEEGAETRTFQQDGASIYNYENANFLKMVASKDWRANPSDFADAVSSLRLTLACDRALTEGTVRL